MDLKCAHCEMKLSDEQVKSVLNDETLNKKYLKFKKNKMVACDKTLAFCEKEECELIKITNMKKRKAKCTTCGYAVCTQCKKKYHGRGDCDKALDRAVEEWAKDKQV